MFYIAPSSKSSLLYHKIPTHISLSGHLSTITKPGGDRRFYLIFQISTLLEPFPIKSSKLASFKLIMAFGATFGSNGLFG